MDDVFEIMMHKQQKQQVVNVLDCNTYTGQYGLSLSEKEVLQLITSRKESLKEQERVEFQGGILPKLIYVFCDSPYIYQDNYVDSIERLQQIFYYYKNESLEELSDDELLQFMKENFDGDCQGSLDYLEETCLDNIARMVREQSSTFFRQYGREHLRMENEYEEE